MECATTGLASSTVETTLKKKQLMLLRKNVLISHFGKLKRELFEIPFLQLYSVCYNSKLTAGEFYLTYWLIFNFLCPLDYLLVKNF